MRKKMKVHLTYFLRSIKCPTSVPRSDLEQLTGTFFRVLTVLKKKF